MEQVSVEKQLPLDPQQRFSLAPSIPEVEAAEIMAYNAAKIVYSRTHKQLEQFWLTSRSPPAELYRLCAKLHLPPLKRSSLTGGTASEGARGVCIGLSYGPLHQPFLNAFGRAADALVKKVTAQLKDEDPTFTYTALCLTTGVGKPKAAYRPSRRESGMHAMAAWHTL